MKPEEFELEAPENIEYQPSFDLALIKKQSDFNKLIYDSGMKSDVAEKLSFFDDFQGFVHSDFSFMKLHDYVKHDKRLAMLLILNLFYSINFYASSCGPAHNDKVALYKDFLDVLDVYGAKLECLAFVDGKAQSLGFKTRENPFISSSCLRFHFGTLTAEFEQFQKETDGRYYS